MGNFQDHELMLNRAGLKAGTDLGEATGGFLLIKEVLTTVRADSNAITRNMLYLHGGTLMAFHDNSSSITPFFSAAPGRNLREKEQSATGSAPILNESFQEIPCPEPMGWTMCN